MDWQRLPAALSALMETRPHATFNSPGAHFAITVNNHPICDIRLHLYSKLPNICYYCLSGYPESRYQRWISADPYHCNSSPDQTPSKMRYFSWSSNRTVYRYLCNFVPNMMSIEIVPKIDHKHLFVMRSYIWFMLVLTQSYPRLDITWLPTYP